MKFWVTPALCRKAFKMCDPCYIFTETEQTNRTLEWESSTYIPLHTITSLTFLFLLNFYYIWPFVGPTLQMTYIYHLISGLRNNSLTYNLVCSVCSGYHRRLAARKSWVRFRPILHVLAVSAWVLSGYSSLHIRFASLNHL